MKEFKIRQDGFNEIKKKMLLRAVPVLLVAVTGGIVVGSINSTPGTEEVNVLPMIIPFAAVTVGFGLYRGVNRQKALFESYRLTITDNLITREQLNTPTISIYFNDVKEIIKNKDGSFTVKGVQAGDLIGIPAQIEGYSQLEDALGQIRAIITKDKVPLLQKYPGLAGLAAVGLMVCVYTVNNKAVVAVAGSILVALMLRNFIKIWKSKNVDSKTKRSVWWILIVLASVIAAVVMKLAL